MGISTGIVALGLCMLASNPAMAQGKSAQARGQLAAPEILSPDDVKVVIASSSGLSHADSGKALEGFISATSRALADQGTAYCWRSTGSSTDPDSDGDGVPDGTEFGVFSVVGTGVSSTGCPPGNDVAFHAGTAFSASKASQADRCEQPVRGASDADLIRGMADASGLPEETATLAYDTILSVIVEVVNAGGIVDLGGFGRFQAETVITASVSAPRDTPILYVDVWEYSLSGPGGSQDDIDQLSHAMASISKRSARTGRDPQNNRKVTTVSEQTVKFKAGAELSKAVN